jgi:hypothetical protein
MTMGCVISMWLLPADSGVEAVQEAEPAACAWVEITPHLCPNSTSYPTVSAHMKIE